MTPPPTLPERARRAAPVAALVLAALAGLVFTVVHARHAPRAARVERAAGDQLNIGTMVLRQAQPEALAGDYFFADAGNFSFYTPTFVTATRWLDGATGDTSRSLALLVGPLCVVYLVGAFLLFRALGGSTALAAALALTTAVVRPIGLGELWGVADWRAVLPRTVYAAALPWLCWYAVKHLGRETDGGAGAGTAGAGAGAGAGRVWLWLPLGIGILANVHPVTALHVAAIAGVWLAMALGARATLRRLPLMLGALLVGALPMLWSYVGGTEAIAGEDQTTFAEFAAVLRQRLPGYFFPFKELGVPAARQWTLCWIVAAAAGAGVIAWAFHQWRPLPAHVRRAVFAVLVGAGVLAVLPLLGKGAAATPLVWLVGAWALVAAWRGPGRIDWGIATALLVVVFLVFVMSPLLGWWWRTREAAGLSALMLEMPRASRLALLPLVAAVARLVGLGLTRERDPIWRGALVAAAVAATLWPWKGLEARLGPRRLDPMPAHERELFAFARTTPPGSAFFVDFMPLRYYGQRGLTHSWKDLGLAYYSRGRLVSTYKRYNRLVAARGVPARLLTEARAAGADYILLGPRDAAPPGLAVAWQNSAYVIYALPAADPR